jgi:hypothetical protein
VSYPLSVSSTAHREFVEKDRFREALSEYENAAKLDLQDDEVQYQLALAHLKLEITVEVDLVHRGLFKVVRLEPSQSDTKLDLARLHADAVLWVEAMTWMDLRFGAKAWFVRAAFRKEWPSSAEP